MYVSWYIIDWYGRIYLFCRKTGYTLICLLLFISLQTGWSFWSLSKFLFYSWHFCKPCYLLLYYFDISFKVCCFGLISDKLAFCSISITGQVQGNAHTAINNQLKLRSAVCLCLLLRLTKNALCGSLVCRLWNPKNLDHAGRQTIRSLLFSHSTFWICMNWPKK